MKYHTRTFYSDKQKSEMWDRWQRGDSISSIGWHVELCEKLTHFSETSRPTSGH